MLGPRKDAVAFCSHEAMLRVWRMQELWKIELDAGRVILCKLIGEIGRRICDLRMKEQEGKREDRGKML